MARNRILQIYRGTTAQNDAFTGAAGELTMDTTTNELRLHDGSTVGGHIIGSGSGGADTSLSNLTSTGQNIANWSSNVSNCITEIPQDIKLELNNGTLTLKAGSKVYVPNGLVTDTVTIANDITFTMTWGGNSKRLFFIRPDGNNWVLDEREVSFSGTTAPTSDEYSLWFDIVHNLVKMTSDYGSTWTSGLSFPIALITNTNNITTSIDQIFNGFGYIGSTVFALPGVKGLIPSGRNADGTLKNTAFTTSHIWTETDTTGGNDDVYIVIKSSGLYRKTKTSYTYNKEENLNIYNGANDSTTPICWHSRTSGIISNFTPKQVFHAVDYNDTEYIAHNAMPSDRYIDLTLGANGTTYTAPADGYVFLRKHTVTANRFIGLYMHNNVGVSSMVVCPVANRDSAVFIPVKKGQMFDCYYDMNGATDEFRFVYAQGDIQ